MTGVHSNEALRVHAWEEPKRPSESPRAAGALLDAHIRADDDFRERETLLRQALASAEEEGDTLRLPRAHHRLGLHLEAEGALQQAEAMLRTASASANESNCPQADRAAIANDHGVTLARLGQLVEAESQFARAVELASPDELGGLWSAAEANQGLMAWVGGDEERALACWNGAFRTARESDEAAVNAQVLIHVAIRRLQAEEGEAALQLLNRAVLLAQRAGDVRTLAFAYNNIGILFSSYPRGDHSAAIPFVEMALALLVGTVDVVARLNVLNNNVLTYEQVHFEPARKFRTQFTETLKSISFAYPSRWADIEPMVFARGQVELSEAAGHEWEIYEHPVLLRSCARCGVRE